MKKQFTIKPVQDLKVVKNSVSKAESNNLMKFVLAADACCANVTFGFTGLSNSKPVFSL